MAPSAPQWHSPKSKDASRFSVPHGPSPSRISVSTPLAVRGLPERFRLQSDGLPVASHLERFTIAVADRRLLERSRVFSEELAVLLTVNNASESSPILQPAKLNSRIVDGQDPMTSKGKFPKGLFEMFKIWHFE
eukprot:CAMPEP_0198139736 /NCGR_PEP_ID=MMETSP1443-20131203/2986_1 /TAXON_ID=186043 /ORGANISM="Entomoneis sp., Strain CCMP2396" /LENGTH=133 /DNA_ID=CAMNT_0043801939 /DNA_START=207 /DNA_END=605 /DNA_ORIENTATION=-